MVVDVLITERQTIDPLLQQMFDRRLSVGRIAVIGKARRQAWEKIQVPLNFPKQHATAIGI